MVEIRYLLKPIGLFGTIKIAGRITKVLTTLILARYITPTEYGHISIALLTMSLLAALSDFGFQTVVLKQNNIKDFLNIGWTLQVAKGVLILGLILSLGESLLQYLDKAEALPFLYVISLSPLLKGLTNPGLLLKQRKLDFSSEVLYELLGVLLPSILSLISISYFQSGWVIIISYVLSQLLLLMFSFLPSIRVPLRLEFNKRKLSIIWSMSKWLVLANILSIIVLEGDTFLAARVFSARDLGIYAMAYTVVHRPIMEIVKSINKVLYPYLINSLNLDPSKFVHLSSPLFYVLISLTILHSLIVVVYPLILTVVFPIKWHSIIVLIPIMSLALIFRIIVVIMTPVFNALGNSDYIFVVSLSRVVSMASLIFLYRSDLSLLVLANIMCVVHVIGFLIVLGLLAFREYVNLKAAIFVPLWLLIVAICTFFIL